MTRFDGSRARLRDPSQATRVQRSEAAESRRIALRPGARVLVIAALAPLVVLLAPGVASAFRPFDGTDGDVAAPGDLELEFGPLHYAREGKETVFLTPSALNLGVASRLEFVVDFVELYPRRGPVHVIDTDVLAKYLLRAGVLQGRGGPSMAIEAGPLLPEVNGQRGLGAALNFIASERWGCVTLHLNDESEFNRDDHVFGNTANLIGEVDVGSELRPVAELGFAIEPSSGARGYGVLGGIIWTVADDLALDAAARVGSSDGEDTFEARLGLTWSVPVWTGDEEQGPLASERRRSTMTW